MCSLERRNGAPVLERRVPLKEVVACRAVLNTLEVKWKRGGAAPGGHGQQAGDPAAGFATLALKVGGGGDAGRGTAENIELAKQWAGYVEEAAEVLFHGAEPGGGGNAHSVSEGDKRQRVDDRNALKQMEIEERRARNEERKRVLTDGGKLGMKYTAQAMAETR